jgi:hypothetical protein
MGQLGRTVLVFALMSALFAGCAVSPAQVEATRQAWAERDAERARECRQKGGSWMAGGCIFGGQ